MPILVVQPKGKDPRRIEMTKPQLSLGRAEGNDVVLEDPALSRNHARIVLREGRYDIEDLGSMNGVFVNLKRIQGRHTIQPGDRILMGSVELSLEEMERPTVMIDLKAGLPLTEPAMTVHTQKMKTRMISRNGSGSDAEARLHLVEAFTLELLRAGGVRELMDELLDQLFDFLEPDRAAILLTGAEGQLRPIAIRSQRGAKGEEIGLPEGLVEAVLKGRQAILLDRTLPEGMDHEPEPSVLATPFEYEDQVLGFIYLDAKPPRGAFTEEDLSLVTCLANLSTAKLLSQRLEEEKHQVQAQVGLWNATRRIQDMLLPQHPPALEGYHLQAHLQISDPPAGDMWGYHVRADGQLYLALLDFSGRGLEAGVHAAQFLAYLEVWGESLDPAPLVSRISGALSPYFQPEAFLAAILLLLDPKSGKFKYLNAGLPGPILVRGDDTVEVLPLTGQPLGVPGGESPQQKELQLDPRDLLFLHTKGLGANQDATGAELGNEGLTELVRRYARESLEVFQKGMTEGLRSSGSSHPDSDQLWLVLRRDRAYRRLLSWGPKPTA